MQGKSEDSQGGLFEEEKDLASSFINVFTTEISTPFLPTETISLMWPWMWDSSCNVTFERSILSGAGLNIELMVG